MSIVCLVIFMIGSLQLIKEYREFCEFKRDEESFNEYKNKESEYLEQKIKGDDFDWQRAGDRVQPVEYGTYRSDGTRCGVPAGTDRCGAGSNSG